MKYPECDPSDPIGPRCVDCGTSFHLPDGSLLLHHRKQRGRVCTNCIPVEPGVGVHTCHAVRVKLEAATATPPPAPFYRITPEQLRGANFRRIPASHVRDAFRER